MSHPKSDYFYMSASVAETLVFSYLFMVDFIMALFFHELQNLFTCCAIGLSVVVEALLSKGDNSKPIAGMGILLILVAVAVITVMVMVRK